MYSIIIVIEETEPWVLKTRFLGPIPQNISSVTTKDLVRWAYEVASGMEYVSTKNVRSSVTLLQFPYYIYSLMLNHILTVV